MKSIEADCVLSDSAFLGWCVSPLSSRMWITAKKNTAKPQLGSQDSPDPIGSRHKFHIRLRVQLHVNFDCGRHPLSHPSRSIGHTRPHHTPPNRQTHPFSGIIAAGRSGSRWISLCRSTAETSRSDPYTLFYNTSIVTFSGLGGRFYSIVHPRSCASPSQRPILLYPAPLDTVPSRFPRSGEDTSTAPVHHPISSARSSS